MLHQKTFIKIFKRYISKKQKNRLKYNHLSSSITPITPSQIACEYFDTVYGSYFGDRWPSIRLALHCQSKYSILYNNYSHNLENIRRLQEESDWKLKNIWDLINISTEYSLKLSKYQANTIEGNFEQEEVISTDENKFDDIVGDISNSLHIKLDKQNSDPLESLKDEKISRLLDFSHVPTSEIVDIDAERAALDDYKPNNDFDNKTVVPLEIYKEKTFFIPKNISFYAYDRGNTNRFPSSGMTNKGLLEYYIMDAASIIPVLALDIKPENKILDLCAAPGGKSLAAIQTQNFGSITCVEKSLSRFRRMEKVFDIYLPKSSKFRERVKSLNLDARGQNSFRDSFDRVLVDVPCTSDRKALQDDENNLFSKSRFRERSTLPQLQMELLVNGIKYLKPGGFLTYSTCSLSSLQNDAIIQAAHAYMTRNEPHIKFRVRNCLPLCQLFKNSFSFYDSTQKSHNRKSKEKTISWLPHADNQMVSYGHLIIPHLPRNWGPLYFCKLERIA